MKRLCFVMSVMVLGLTLTGYGNLIQNGDFELPVIPPDPGYVLNTNPTGWTGNCTMYAPMAGFTTSQVVGLDNHDTYHNLLVQNFGVVPGQQYRLTFKATEYNDHANLELTIYENAAPFAFLKTESIPISWHEFAGYTVDWTAQTAGANGIMFLFPATESKIFLDDVSVIAVPEPATLGLLCLGLVGLLRRR